MTPAARAAAARAASLGPTARGRIASAPGGGQDLRSFAGSSTPSPRTAVGAARLP